MERGGDLLFVYGTLKRGFANHRQLGGAPFAGEMTMPGIDLHDLGPFPMAIVGTGCAHGELYRVADSLLAALDRFEGAPRLYERQRLPLADGRQAWVYLGRPRQVRHSPRLADGRWPAAPAAEDAAPGDQDGRAPRSPHATADPSLP